MPTRVWKSCSSISVRARALRLPPFNYLVVQISSEDGVQDGGSVSLPEINLTGVLMLRFSGSYPRCRYMYMHSADGSASRPVIWEARGAPPRNLVKERRRSFRVLCSLAKTLPLLSFLRPGMVIAWLYSLINNGVYLGVSEKRGWRTQRFKTASHTVGWAGKDVRLKGARWHEFPRRAWHRPHHRIIAQYDGSNASRGY